MDKKVLIIGAGAAGVAAAVKLLSNGFKNVTILEAENRIGGRVHTIPYGANVIDMGAQWCHGEKNNVVYDLAKDKNVLARSAGQQRITFVRSNGEVISNELANKIIELSSGMYSGEATAFKVEQANYRGSLGNFIVEKFKAALATDEFKDINAELAHQSLEAFQKYIKSVDASDSWYNTSCNTHGYEECEGDPSLDWKDKGYVTVFDLLQNKIPGGENPQPVIDIIPLVQFNKEVRKILYNQPDGLVKVECTDGSSFTADHLVCTVSLGVLKDRHLEMFEPLLPLEKYIAIDGMMIGTVNKIYLEYDEPFWNSDWDGFTIFWNLQQIKEVREDPVNGDWVEELMGFYPFNSFQPKMLCGWIVGPMARIMEQKSDADVKAGSEKVIRMFLKGKTIPDAKRMVRTKWHSNPHFRGSYSNYTLKAEALGASTDKLTEPINGSNGKPIIQFAGEATSAKHYGNVHGAIETGWREADRLIDLYK